MTTPRELQCGEIDDLLCAESGLSPWGLTFVDDIANVLDAGGTLTDRQVAKVHEVWDRHCG